MPTIQEAVAGYRKLRERKSELAERHKAEMKPITDKMAAIENWLQLQLQEAGMDSSKTPDGTAYLTRTASVKVTDWGEAIQYIVDNGLFHVLEQRLSVKQIEEFVAEEKQNFPGTNITYTTNLRVRK